MNRLLFEALAFAGVYLILLLLLLKGKLMSDSIKDLDDAIAALSTQEQQNEATLAASVQLIIDDCNTLLQKVSQGQDFTPEVTSIQATAQKLAAAIATTQAAISAEDQKVNPPGPSDFRAPKT